MKNIKALAFVLPQFHPIPENDLWWGKGFTEWTNVAKAKPLFDGHYQPQLPTDLGYYDLRLDKSREDQANLAKEYGIHGFCYYHYWFNGKRLLHEPLDEMLCLQKPDMPFMYCWANENWTRRWDGMEQDVLMKQEYGEEDDKDHISWLCENVFSDKRYIRVDNKPVFLIYRHDLFPDILKTLENWRDIATTKYGYDGLHMCLVQGFYNYSDPTTLGFDAAIEFAPHEIIKHPLKKDEKALFPKLLNSSNKNSNIDFRDFKKGVDTCINREIPSYKLFRCVTPCWDNTPRKGEKGIVAKGSSPAVYEDWLEQIIDKFEPYSEDENFVFINAMNEWAEGNHLEPCSKYGRQYLEATKNALKQNH